MRKSPSLHFAWQGLLVCLVAVITIPRCSAAAAAEGEKQEKNVEMLIGELQSAERDVRKQAAYDLAKKGAAAKLALRALLLAMDDPEPLVREAAACALGEIGEEAESAVPALIKMVQGDVRMENRHMAVKALGKIGPPSKTAVKILMDIAKGGAGETGDLPFRQNKRPQPLIQSQILRCDAIRSIGQTRCDENATLGFLLQVLQSGAADADGHGSPYFVAAAEAVSTIGNKFEPILVTLERAKRIAGNGGGPKRVREAADKALRKLKGDAPP